MCNSVYTCQCVALPQCSYVGSKVALWWCGMTREDICKQERITSSMWQSITRVRPHYIVCVTADTNSSCSNYIVVFRFVFRIRVAYFPVLSQVASLVLNPFNWVTIKIRLNLLGAKAQNTTELETNVLSDDTVLVVLIILLTPPATDANCRCVSLHVANYRVVSGLCMHHLWTAPENMRILRK